MKSIKQGSVIKGPNWPESVEIKLIEEAGEYVHIVGATTDSGAHIDQIIPRDEFSTFSTAGIGATFSEEPWKVFLAPESIKEKYPEVFWRNIAGTRDRLIRRAKYGF